MEPSENLAIESFSRSWLTSVKSSLDGLEESFRPSLDSFFESTSEELDYRILKKGFLGEVENFNFDVRISEFHDPLAPADQLFSDGIIKPVYINKSKIEASDSFLAPTFFSSSASSRTLVPIVDVRCRIIKKWRNSVEKILLRWSGYLRPLCHKLIGARKSRRVGDIDRRAKRVHSSYSSPQLSPAITHSSTDFRDIEHSINEAILHCKRSTDK